MIQNKCLHLLSPLNYCSSYFGLSLLILELLLRTVFTGFQSQCCGHTPTANKDIKLTPVATLPAKLSQRLVAQMTSLSIQDFYDSVKAWIQLLQSTNELCILFGCKVTEADTKNKKPNTDDHKEERQLRTTKPRTR